MNISYPPIHIQNLPPAFSRLGNELPKAIIYLLIPTELLYFALYFKIKSCPRLYRNLTFASVVAFWASPLVAPIECGPVKCLQNFAIAIGTMKALDLYARRNSLPTYSAGSRPADWHLALLLVTELRYESFTPNHVRVPHSLENFSEILQLGIHIVAFVALQSLPQIFPTVLAFEVLLSIYILWTSLQLLVRYKSSPALFGPLYKADSLTGFWSETWHNAFASPCTSLAYAPLRQTLPRFGIPLPFARAAGVLGAFALMGVFHMYALAPILDREALYRIGIFFVLNGVGTVVEALIWGHKRHWAKTVLAWAFETTVASWAAEGCGIPNGLSKVRWREVCDARGY